MFFSPFTLSFVSRHLCSPFAEHTKHPTKAHPPGGKERNTACHFLSPSHRSCAVAEWGMEGFVALIAEFLLFYKRKCSAPYGDRSDHGRESSPRSQGRITKPSRSCDLCVDSSSRRHYSTYVCILSRPPLKFLLTFNQHCDILFPS